MPTKDFKALKKNLKKFKSNANATLRKEIDCQQGFYWI